jgi:hypothetical protein
MTDRGQKGTDRVAAGVYRPEKDVYRAQKDADRQRTGLSLRQTDATGPETGETERGRVVSRPGRADLLVRRECLACEKGRTAARQRCPTGRRASFYA